MAQQTEDPDIVAATMAAPGLKRPVGFSEPFREHSDLPKHIGDSGQPSRSAKIVKSRSRRRPGEITDPAAERKAALEFEKEERRRERQRAKEEAARQQAIEKAQGALDKARRKYEGSAADIRAEIQKLQERLQTKEAKWEKERARIEAALHRARMGS